jgi:tetratricopeptide (TPR) repeat protein
MYNPTPEHFRVTDLKILLAVLLLATSLLAQDHQHAATPAPPIALQPGMGNLHHPIATSNPEAQKFFDQGLTLVYGFNHSDAIRSFQRAAELDPRSPMPWWGMALAPGPNYNVDVDPAGEKAAYDAIQKALSLSANAPVAEQDYVQALATRYTNDPKANYRHLALNYRDAMRALATRYPDDPDAVTLYAESMMDLNPWQLWTADGKPAEGTTEIVTTLEGVLRAYPTHVGANHFYIHAVEASPRPERALPSESNALAAIVTKTPADAPYGLNHAKTVMQVAAAVLDGKMAAAAGNTQAALADYRKAVTLQDQLKYDEPQDWYYPVRETLGAALLQSGDATAAQAIFREDLAQNPRNGRSLYGLSKALEAQKKTTEAAWVSEQFKVAWAQADTQPNLVEY